MVGYTSMGPGGTSTSVGVLFYFKFLLALPIYLWYIAWVVSNEPEPEETT